MAQILSSDDDSIALVEQSGAPLAVEQLRATRLLDQRRRGARLGFDSGAGCRGSLVACALAAPGGSRLARGARRSWTCARRGLCRCFHGVLAQGDSGAHRLGPGGRGVELHERLLDLIALLGNAELLRAD